MLCIRIFSKSAQALTYCRHHALKSCIKRCYCAVSAKELGVGEEGNSKPGRQRKITISQDAQDTLLNFLNNCDTVTLNKLRSFKKRQLFDYDLELVYKKQYTEKRYTNFDDLLKKTGIALNQVEVLVSSILQFEKMENSSSSMKFLLPKFDRKNIEDIDKVVALDVFHGDIAWCVRNTEDDYITDIGFTQLNLKDLYDHVDHHKQIRKFLEVIPESEVYLIRRNTVQGTLKSKKASIFNIHQAVVEAIIITLLNERHLPKDYHLNEHSKEEGSKTRFLNKVHGFQPLALKEFYDVTFEKELLPVSDIFKEWYAGNHPNLQKWGLNEDERRKLFFSYGSRQVSVCALISDVFCRSLQKRWKQFPHAYS